MVKDVNAECPSANIREAPYDCTPPYGACCHQLHFFSITKRRFNPFTISRAFCCVCTGSTCGDYFVRLFGQKTLGYQRMP